MTRAELLELLKKARKQLKKYHVPKDEQTVTLSIDTLETALSEQPQIVRCKDCRWGEYSKNARGEDMVFCYNGDTGIEDGYLHEPDWFCAAGEREEGETE